MAEHRIRPPAEVARIPYEIVRVGKQKVIEFWSLSEVPVVIAIHWTGSRAVRCTEVECEYCATGKPQRWRGYVFGQSVRNSRVSIVEYTGGVGGAIADFYERHGSLRGAQIVLARTGKRANGPLSVQFGDSFQRSDNLPEVPDLFDIVCRIYDLKDSRELAEGQVTATVHMRARHA